MGDSSHFDDVRAQLCSIHSSGFTNLTLRNSSYQCYYLQLTLHNTISCSNCNNHPSGIYLSLLSKFYITPRNWATFCWRGSFGSIWLWRKTKLFYTFRICSMFINFRIWSFIHDSRKSCFILDGYLGWCRIHIASNRLNP